VIQAPGKKISDDFEKRHQRLGRLRLKEATSHVQWLTTASGYLRIRPFEIGTSQSNSRSISCFQDEKFYESLLCISAGKEIPYCSR